jgi:hypothetical protein
MAQSQDLRATIQLDARRFLVGEPIVIRGEVTNVSKKTLYLAYGEKGCRSFPVLENMAGDFSPFCPPQDVKKVDWGEGYEIKPLAPGESLQRIETLCDFTRVFAKPGNYRIRWRTQSLGPYEKRIGNQVLQTYPNAWSGTVDSGTVQFEILAPVGVDREALDKIIRPAVEDPRRLPGPHLWADKVLEKYPSSTYAGYALAQSGPGGSLSWSEKWSKLTAQQRDDAWYVPQVASKEAQDARRKQVREGYEEFAKKACAFLAIHPDFARADILRKELANALFMLDRRDEALEQLELLAKMTGPVAEEAQKTLQACGEAAPQPPQAGSK